MTAPWCAASARRSGRRRSAISRPCGLEAARALLEAGDMTRAIGRVAGRLQRREFVLATVQARRRPQPWGLSPSLPFACPNVSLTRLRIPTTLRACTIRNGRPGVPANASKTSGKDRRMLTSLKAAFRYFNSVVPFRLGPALITTVVLVTLLLLPVPEGLTAQGLGPGGHLPDDHRRDHPEGHADRRDGADGHRGPLAVAGDLDLVQGRDRRCADAPSTIR